ncbi:MAG: glycoside hydrolase family 127 protein, partial [Planctomycetota bacterium]|nr:glycoside hydrolase family 127 protein [Planctomycetota bacterium]
FGTSCCPVNVVRTIPSVPGMQWAVQGDAAVACLLQSGTVQLRIADRAVTLRMETGWPWDGTVRVVVEEVEEGGALPFTIRVRVPNGARAVPAPGGLYEYADDSPAILATDWVEERVAWSAGSSAEWEFPLPVRRVIARDEVAACRGRVAIERGPIVYCIEGVDHDGRVEDLWLPDDAALTPRWEPDLLGGVTVLEGVGLRAVRAADGSVQSVDAPIRMIPYYAWANRGSGGMAVWIPRSPALARLPAMPTLATDAPPSASHVFELDTLAALHDGLHPESSGDHSVPRHTFWPRLGTEEWLRYDFAAPTQVSAVRVYWFDDTGLGRCRVPANAQVETLAADGAWQAVNAFVPLGVAINAWNEQSFAPVTTTAIRLRIRLQEEFSAGMLEWEVR